MRQFGKYLLANPLHALLIALFCALLPFVLIPGGFIAAIVIGLVTLCKGARIGFIILLGVALPVIALNLWKIGSLFDLLLIHCGLVWLLASVLRATGSWRLVLEIMTIIGIMVVIGFHWVLPDVSMWWIDLLKKHAANLRAFSGGQITEDKLIATLGKTVSIITGCVSDIVLLGVFTQLLVARWWQAAMFRPGALAKEFFEIRNSPWIAIVLAATVFAALLDQDLALDLLPILIMPFLIEGLSLLHQWARIKKEIVYLLIAAYIGLIFLPLLLITILALAGYIDSWYDLRKRFFVVLR